MLCNSGEKTTIILTVEAMEADSQPKNTHTQFHMTTQTPTRCRTDSLLEPHQIKFQRHFSQQGGRFFCYQQTLQS